MKVYGHPLSSCTRKVLITLAEKRAPRDLVTVDLFTAAQKKADHLARHPFGVVPVLEDGNFRVYESRAIIRYLDATLLGPRLTPQDPRQTARMDQWLSVDQSYVGPYTRALAVERILKKHEGKEPDAQIVRESEEALAKAFCVHDAALAGREWLAGDALSLADISLAPYLASLPMIGAEHVLAGLTHLGAWWERLRSRESVAGAIS
jgi:glutathione S-transferase